MTSTSPTEDEFALQMLEHIKQHPLPLELTQDYRDYLNSKLWRKIRQRVLKRDNKTCRRCGGKGTVVHHRSYSPAVMLGDDDNQLVTLCEGCHTIIEIDEQGNRRSEVEKERVLLQKDESYDHPIPKIDLRRLRQKPPDNWSRMTAKQREVWGLHAFALTISKKKKRVSDELMSELRKYGVKSLTSPS